MAVSLGRVLVAGGVVILAMMLGSGSMGLGRLLVVLSGFRMGVLGHDHLHSEGTLACPLPTVSVPNSCLS